MAKIVLVWPFFERLIYMVITISIFLLIFFALSACSSVDWDFTGQSKGTINGGRSQSTAGGSTNVTRNQIPPNGGTDEKSDSSPVEPP